MSEAESDTEKVEPQTSYGAEQLDSATEPKATVTQTATETVTKVKKIATPRQLEALRVARVKKMEKAAARKAEYAKLIEKVGVEQSDSESSAEYVIKRVRKKGKKVTKEVIVTPTPVTPPITKHTPRGGSSDGENDQTQPPPQTQQKKKKSREPNPPPELFTLNFV
jgi:hypothetical protein